MHRRTFLWGCAVPAIAQNQKPKRPQPYPEQQHPQSKRGRALADFARTLRIRRDVRYVGRPEAELTLDIYSPGEHTSRPRPCILAFVLAAFKKNGVDFRLDLDNLPPSPTPNLYPPILAHGRVLVVARVRVSSQAMFPAQIHDAKCALRWIGENAASLGIDPKRIALFGASASGNLVSLLALTAGGQLDDPSCLPDVSTEVKAVCSLSGIYDFELYRKEPGDGSLRIDGITPYLGKPGAHYREASPAHYAHAGAPPFLLTHGFEDERVPYSQMPHFASLLLDKGVQVETWTIHHYRHGAIPGVQPDPGYAVIDQAVYRFFDRALTQ